MGQSRLTGSRIRERRLFLGQKQSVLAKTVGVSAAYLNLIEHNRRRVSDDLLGKVADQLQVDSRALSEGAEVALLGALREAGQRFGGSAQKMQRAEELASRFPSWAELITNQHQKIRELEQLVEALSDRLTHDPELAASLHEVISAVTAIRSTASILSDSSDIDADWQARFLGNLRDEGRRLSGAAQGLVEYLDAGAEQEMGAVAPTESLAAFLSERDYYLPELEDVPPHKSDAIVDDLIAAIGGVETAKAQDLARRHFQQYLTEARKMPLAAFQEACQLMGSDPNRLAQEFNQPLTAVMRRLAFVPRSAGEAPFGLLSCDGAGALVLRKPLAGFAVPRFGAACPFWPLYQALSRPNLPICATVEFPDPTPQKFICRAICQSRDALRFNHVPVMEAVMLISPVTAGPVTAASSSAEFATANDALERVIEVGSTCRVCPREGCHGRREASILSS